MSVETEFHRRLMKKVNEEDATLTDHLRSGGLDFDMYRDKTGYLRALDHVREWCAEIEKQITEGK